MPKLLKPTPAQRKKLARERDALTARQHEGKKPKLSRDEKARVRELRHLFNVIPEPDWKEPQAMLFNWAGPGWDGPAKTRPVNLFDFAAKLHDFAYEANGLSFKLRKKPDCKYTRSRMAKADFIFRRMTQNCRFDGVGVEIGEWFAGQLFQGRDPATEFVSGDGFHNVLRDNRLNNPENYLVLPFRALTASERRRLTHRPGIAEDYWNTPTVDYLTRVASDGDTESPGWRTWVPGQVRDWDRLMKITSRTGRSWVL